MLLHPPTEHDILENVARLFFSQDGFGTEGLETFRHVGCGLEPEASTGSFRKQKAFQGGSGLQSFSLMEQDWRSYDPVIELFDDTVTQ